MTCFNKNITLIAILAAVTLALTLAVNKDSSLAFNTQGGSSDNDTPVLEYEKADTGALTQKALNRQRGLRQDKRIVELPAGIEPLPLLLNGWAGLQALPVAESDAVILGDVIGRRASLTDDKVGIYSEFSVHLDTVFKDAQGLIAPGGVLTASRPGGAVRFASGKVQRYTVSSQGYPQQGKLYVLFLKRDEQNNFSILTGYELRGAQVLPLDGDGRDSKSDLQFAVYRGVSQEASFKDLRKAVQSATGGGNR